MQYNHPTVTENHAEISRNIRRSRTLRTELSETNKSQHPATSKHETIFVIPAGGLRIFPPPR
jgi:hypothetical protein